jgi:aminoglycoside phosphotransferase family enzyme
MDVVSDVAFLAMDLDHHAPGSVRALVQTYARGG